MGENYAKVEAYKVQSRDRITQRGFEYFVMIIQIMNTIRHGIIFLIGILPE